MDNISPYSGVAGETVRLYARMGTFILLIPSVLFMLVTAGLFLYILDKTGLPQEFGILVGFIAITPVIGAAGIGARSGDLESGISYLFQRSAEVISFVLRYALLTLAWGIPAVLLAVFVLKRAVSGFFNFSSSSAAFAAVMTFVLIVIVILAPVFTLIVALSTNSIKEAFSTQRWKWLLIARVGDLKPLFASYFGGMTLFYIFSIPIVAVLVVIASQISYQAAFIAPMIGGYVPLAAAPVLMGRLAGGFVAVDLQDVETERLVDSAAARKEATEKVQQGVELTSRIKEIVAGAGEDHGKAITDLEALLTEHRDHAFVLVELSAQYAKAGRGGDATKTAVKAIDAMTKIGETAKAADIFLGLGGGRRNIRVSGDAFQRLSQTLTVKKHFDDAVWSLQAGAASGLVQPLVEKGTVAVAEAAARAGDLTKAVQVFEFFIAKYPESDFIGYVQGETKKLRAKKEKESKDGETSGGGSGGTPPGGGAPGGTSGGTPPASSGGTPPASTPPSTPPDTSGPA